MHLIFSLNLRHRLGVSLIDEGGGAEGLGVMTPLSLVGKFVGHRLTGMVFRAAVTLRTMRCSCD